LLVSACALEARTKKEEEGEKSEIEISARTAERLRFLFRGLSAIAKKSESGKPGDRISDKRDGSGDR